MSRGIGAIQAGQAFIQLSLNDKEFKKNLHGARTYMNQWASMLTKVGTTMSLAGAAMVGAFAMITKQVANLESAFRRFDLMFGKMAGAMTAELQKVSEASGFPLSALKEQTATFGAIFAEMRDQITDEQYVKLVGKTMQSVVDLVGLAGISMEEAADRIKSGFTSTGEALDQFGINLRKANLEAEGARLGLKGSVLTWTEQQKQLLKLSIMQRQTARTGITFAATANTINAQLTLMSANIRELLGRMVGFLNRALVPVLRGFNKLLELMRPLAGFLAPLLVLGGIIGGGLAVTGGMVLGLGLLLHVASISIGAWLKLITLIKDFNKFYAIAQAMLKSSGIINLATAAWTRLAGAIGMAAAALKGVSLRALGGWLLVAGGVYEAGKVLGKMEKGIRDEWKRRDELRVALGRRTAEQFWFNSSGDLQGNLTDKSVPVNRNGVPSWFTPRGPAAEVARRAAFAPVAVAGTFAPGLAQQLAFSTASTGTDRTNALLGNLKDIAAKVISDDKVKVTLGLT